MDSTDTKPKWNRRKDARPAEIIEAALDIFAESGFAAAKLGDVAKRAGVVKGTLYRYFDTKEALFRVVVQHAVSIKLKNIELISTRLRGTLRELVLLILNGAAGRMGDSRVPALARLVIGESRNFPDLATIWHDNVVAQMLRLMTGIIAEAQQRGEVRPGDPTLYAFSVLSPMVADAVFQEMFGLFSPDTPELQALAKQHGDTVVRGMLVSVD